MNTLIKKLFFTLSACLLLAASLQIAGAAPPVLNWTRQGTAGGNAFMDCNRTGSVAGGNCETNGNAGFGQGATDPDKAPFLQETVVFDGITYFHVIVGTRGEPTVGDGNTFAQEVYIQVQSGTDCDPTWATAPCSLSGGRRGDNGNYQVNSGVGWDPLSSDSTFSGNGSGNPKAVIMKQVLNDTANGLPRCSSKTPLA